MHGLGEEGRSGSLSAPSGEAEKRDHRKIGKLLDLFHTQEEAPGMVFWHPKGWMLYQIVEQYMRGVFRDNGYQEIRTPQVVDRSLWEKSGHWDKFQAMMFTTHSENRDYAVKPMNCPCHIQVFNQGLKSYRDLPCAWRNSAPATGTSLPARLPALCGCATSPRTMRIFSARSTDPG